MNSPDNNDEQVAAALDAYLAELQAGRQPDRAALLARYPDLALALDSLEALERLAPPKDSATSCATPAPGEFGKFELIEEIGRGGMGVVYRARQKDLDRIVALKIILAGQLASPEHVRRFVAEARAAARLQHPNIVRIFESGEIAGQHFFAMEMIAGRTLAQMRTEDAERAVRLVATVARAVDYLHSQGVVHRDLKPSNILIDSQDCPYVTDFGLAKLLDVQSQATQSGMIVGTPGYMSPEQAASRAGDVGPRSDIFSLGAILYELLAGQPAFQADTPLHTLVKVIEGEPLPLRVANPRVPRELELICLRCLEKDPERRYRSAAALADDLDRFLRGEPVEARSPNVWQRLKHWVRREPALASRLAGLFLCALVAQVNYQLTKNVPLALHLKIMGTLAVWAAASAIWQRLLRREQWASVVRCAWVCTDVASLTTALAIDEALGSPMVVVYPLLIAAAGLWFRTKLVALATVAAIVGYLCLVADVWRQTGTVTQPNWHLIFLVTLAILGFIVAYQVQRVRALSRYYDRRL